MVYADNQAIKLTNGSFFPRSQGKYFYVHKKGHDSVCDWIIDQKTIYEHYVLMMITPILRDCSYMVDIGCHVGTYTFAKILCENYTNTLSIDASQENLEMAKANNNSHNCFKSIHGFWVDSSVSQDYTFISNNFSGDHDDLHSCITSNPEKSSVIPNIRTNAIYEWINEEHKKSSQTGKPGFIKIDIDGSEVNIVSQLLPPSAEISTRFASRVTSP